MAEAEIYSLVLSIFKGENFVVKGGNGKAFLRVRFWDFQRDLCMETGSTKLTGGNPEPEFNSQLAWSLTRKQLKDLRSDWRSTIKVSCIVADEKTNHENEIIGYVILHVRDATGSTSGEVDPTKAVTYPLLGTNEWWRTFQPKLQMILQLEEVSCRSEKIRGHMESLKSGTQRKLVMGGVGDPSVCQLDAGLPLYRCRVEEQDLEVEIWKIEVEVLERKIKSKEAKIDGFLASNSKLKDRVSVLEQENKSLKTLLAELKDQNENLRLQVLASKEHNDLKK